MRVCHEPLAREIGQPLPMFITLNKVTLPYCHGVVASDHPINKY